MEAQHQKSCNEDTGGCGRLCAVRHILNGRPPSVFALQVTYCMQSFIEQELAKCGMVLIRPSQT